MSPSMKQMMKKKKDYTFIHLTFKRFNKHTKNMSLLQNKIKQGEKHKTQKPKRQKYEFFTKIQSFRESTNR